MVSDSFVHACAGGAGGLVAMTATYPLMGISTRAAIDQSKNPGESLAKAVTKVIAKEGLLGLYDGLGSSLIGIGVSNFVYYFFFEATRDFVLRAKQATSAASLGTLTTLESIGAGLISGIATAFISNPIWVVNTRQTIRAVVPEKDADGQLTRKVRRLSFLETMKGIVKQDGIGALWKGIGPALVLVTNPVLQYTVFEQLKGWVLKSRSARASKHAAQPLLGDFDFFWLGALSKLVATAVTYPQIVIKSRQQAMTNESLQGKKMPNVWTAMTDVIQDEGIVGLYRGISSKMLQSILTAAILFSSKERIFAMTKSVRRDWLTNKKMLR